MVDAIDLGLIGLRHDRTLCFANAAAEEILRSGDILSVRNGKLSCCESNSTEALNELIKNASGRKLGALSGGSLTVSNSLRSLYLTVFPTPGPQGIIPDPATVFLTITDPAAPPKSRERLLVKLFRLTPSEARVVTLFLGGLGPEEIAKQRQTTAATVRFQLKVIYRKMGVSRQSQLVRLASRLPGIR